MSETPSSPRPAARRPDDTRNVLFQRIDAIVGSIRPAASAASAASAAAAAIPPGTNPAPPRAKPLDVRLGPESAGATTSVTATPGAPAEADPVFGRLLEKWFALERDRVLGEHLHLDQVQAVAGAYETTGSLRVVR